MQIDSNAPKQPQINRVPEGLLLTDYLRIYYGKYIQLVFFPLLTESV
jgi:hypothetical protein